MLDNGFPQVLIKAWFMKIVMVPSFPEFKLGHGLRAERNKKRMRPENFFPMATPTFRFVLWMRSDERQALLWEELNGLAVTSSF